MRRAVGSQRIAHSYLFTGPEGIGKRHLARRMAAMLNCTGTESACGRCASCHKIGRDVHPDVTLVSPGDGRVKIDQVRTLQHTISLAPYEGRWRVCIVTDFHTATVEAANALLKTLEEPPARAVIILTATDASLLLPTVVSRCQTVALRLVPEGELEGGLAAVKGQEPERARLLARLSAGRVGWAIRAVENPALLEERRDGLEALAGVLGAGRAERTLAAERLAARDDLPEVLRLWQSWWRDLLLLRAGCADLVANVDQAEALRAHASRGSLEMAQSAARNVEDALRQLDENVNTRMVLDVLLQGWPLSEAARS